MTFDKLNKIGSWSSKRIVTQVSETQRRQPILKKLEFMIMRTKMGNNEENYKEVEALVNKLEQEFKIWHTKGINNVTEEEIAYTLNKFLIQFSNTEQEKVYGNIDD